MVLHRGRFATVDLADVRRKVANRVAELTEMNRETRTLVHQVETIVERFCVGLARQPYHLHHVVCE
jgi:hypothetical protein